MSWLDTLQNMAQGFVKQNPNFWGAVGGGGAAPVAPQAAPFDLGAIVQALNAPRGRHLGIGGQEITNDNPMGHAGGDPWKNGTFKPHDAFAGMSYLGASSPQQITNFFKPQQAPAVPLTAGANGMPFGVMPPQGGMINPGLPDDQRFKDSNFWSAVGSVKYPRVQMR